LKLAGLIVCGAMLPGLVQCAGAAAATNAPLDAYNYVVGTQTIGAAYQFTQEPKLVETARAILAMGSRTLKFYLEPQGGSGPKPVTLAETARDDPAVKSVFEMPFVNYVMWASPVGAPGGGPFAAARLGAERQELYDLAKHCSKPTAALASLFTWAIGKATGC